MMAATNDRSGDSRVDRVVMNVTLELTRLDGGEDLVAEALHGEEGVQYKGAR